MGFKKRAGIIEAFVVQGSSGIHGVLCSDMNGVDGHLLMHNNQFTYVNAAFTPAPDDIVGNLFRCFGTEGHLIINYR